MNILILGGTVFLGRQMVETALEGGHRVTLFNRGLRNPELFPEVERLRGDRRGDLSALRGRRWDAVVDTSGYVPGVVRASAEALKDAVDRYVFISSLSVYSDYEGDAVDESTPVNRITPEQLKEAEEVIPSGPVIAVNYGAAYGGLKALCEEEAERAMPGRAVNVRVGLIVGPHDYSDRFTYWPTRIKRGGEVLAPGEPDRPKELIDVRDVAEWVVRVLETGETGTFNVIGPGDRLSMKGLLEECRAATASDASFTWVSDDFLLKNEVQPWREMPLWIPREYERAAFQAVNCDRAISAGLKFRPLAETILDTLHWDAQRPKDTERHAGLDAEKERRLLQLWKERAS
ncbi:MAG TPA: NAD-dependent epimerase/dehydratase family protein [Pyrinomonadaceae bacterium]|nr:NAD-dependent epimerase/dehydratase family protein [Pyrinomonadaceae bacterium]